MTRFILLKKAVFIILVVEDSGIKKTLVLALGSQSTTGAGTGQDCGGTECRLIARVDPMGMQSNTC
jgi:hypothetical protein